MAQSAELLRKKLEKYNRLYYDENISEISDQEYDELKKEYQKLIQNDLFGEEFVGYKPNEKFQKITHKNPMLSLDNAFENQDVIDFDSRVMKYLGITGEILYTAELKIDGLSFSAVYKSGILEYVCTRGDGKTGEDVSENVKQISGFPHKLTGEKIPEILEIRGEIYMSRENFEKITAKQVENNEKPFANPRNAASGSLRVLDSNITKSRNLSYFAYSLNQIDDEFGVKNHSEALNLLANFGFSVNENRITGNINKCLEFYRNIEEKRADIGYDIDGIVYKVDNFTLQSRMGNTSNSPRWAIAHKFSGIKAITEIISIDYQVGRLGNITPVANLKPVNIGGVMVSRATLHNFDEMKRLKVQENSRVLVQRAGDVVPQIVEVLDKCDEVSIDFPKNCPSCGSLLVISNDLVAIKCDNSDGCKEQIIQKLIHFTSKNALDIEGLGDKQITRFYELGYISEYADIFNLESKKNDILNLERFGSKSVANLLNSIEIKRNISMSRFLYSISITHVGALVAEKMAYFFENSENFTYCISSTKNIQNTKTELEKIDSFGSKIANSFADYFSHIGNVSKIRNLLQKITLYNDVKKSSIDAKYYGKTIIFTGTLLKMTRQEAKNTAQNLGFKIASSVSKNVNLVVAGSDAGSKLKNAHDLGIKVINENDWLQIVNNQDFEI